MGLGTSDCKGFPVRKYGAVPAQMWKLKGKERNLSKDAGDGYFWMSELPLMRYGIRRRSKVSFRNSAHRQSRRQATITPFPQEDLHACKPQAAAP